MAVRPATHISGRELRTLLGHERVLVTGGAGFIGARVVRRLLGVTPTVGVLDDFSAGTWANLAPCLGRGLAEGDIIEADISDCAAMEAAARWAPTLIVHLAAQSKVDASMHDPIRDAEINIIGTLNVLAVARSVGVRYVVAASSGGTIYGQAGIDGLQVDETTRDRPVSPYGIAKSAADDYLTLSRREYGLRCVSLAIGNAYGPSVDGGPGEGVAAAFATSLVGGHPATIHGDGEQTRDFVYVEDVADAFVRACAFRPVGRINIGSGTGTPLNRLLDQIASLANIPAMAELVPAVRGEVRHIRLDIRQAARKLGWRPGTTLSAGLRNVIDAVHNRQQVLPAHSQTR